VTRAIIYVPDGEFDPHASRCMEYCKRRGYKFEGIIRGDWEEANRMMQDGQTSVVLVSTESHLPPQRKPRIEVVANEEREPGMERTRILRRNAGA
jgi:hypothetical protein